AGYQGAGSDPVKRFCAELEAAGGRAYHVRDHHRTVETVVEIVLRNSVKKALLGRGPFIDGLGLERFLAQANVAVFSPREIDERTNKEKFFGADVGITGVQALVAETGSVILSSSPDEPRSLSLLPPVHIAVAAESQIVADLFDLFDIFSQSLVLPSCVSLITGPSKTGDIELRLVTGVHGPGELHV